MPKLITSIAITALAFLATPVAAQKNDVTYAATNPLDSQFRVHTSDGVIVVADGLTETLYVSSQNGSVSEVSFQDAVNSLNVDVGSKARILQDFKQSLSDPNHMATITQPRVATDTRIWINEPQMCGQHICIIFDSVGDTEFNQSLATSCNHYLCPKLPFPCDLGPCSPRNWGDNLFVYSGLGAGWGDSKGGGSISHQQLVAYDKSRWEKEKKEQCDSMKWNGAATLGTGVAVAASCVSSVTGLGALVCAGSVVAFGSTFYDYERSAKTCYSSYPGAGNW